MKLNKKYIAIALGATLVIGLVVSAATPESLVRGWINDTFYINLGEKKEDTTKVKKTVTFQPIDGNWDDPIPVTTEKEQTGVIGDEDKYKEIIVAGPSNKVVSYEEEVGKIDTTNKEEVIKAIQAANEYTAEHTDVIVVVPNPNKIKDKTETPVVEESVKEEVTDNNVPVVADTIEIPEDIIWNSETAPVEEEIPVAVDHIDDIDPTNMVRNSGTVEEGIPALQEIVNLDPSTFVLNNAEPVEEEIPVVPETINIDPSTVVYD